MSDDIKQAAPTEAKATAEATATPEAKEVKIHTPRLLGKSYFQRKKGCPFSGPRAQTIDYKNTRILTRFVSDYGKILPRHITGVCSKKQRELAVAIKRARVLALMTYTGRNERG